MIDKDRKRSLISLKKVKRKKYTRTKKQPKLIQEWFKEYNTQMSKEVQ